MSAARVWRTLGIKRTEDVRTIRRAYADRLRALDVDSDPEAFAALREAREAALGYALAQAGKITIPPGESGDDAPVADARSEIADRGPDDGIWSEPEPGPGHGLTLPLSVLGPPAIHGDGDAALSVTAPGVPDEPVVATDPDARRATQPVWNAPAPPVAPWGAAPEGIGGHGDVIAGMRRSDTDEHFEAIYALFFSGQEGQLPDLDDRQVVALRVHADAILASPRMEEIDFHADTERWMSEVIARACPESDPLVRRVADYFGWMARADEIGLPPAIDFVVRRARSLDFLDQVRERRHPLHAAWRELSRPANETSRRGRVPAKQVSGLLALVRRDHPALESLFDPYRVSLWEPGQGRELAADRISAWWAIIPAFLLLRFCASMADDERPQPNPFPVPVEAPGGGTVPAGPVPIAAPLSAPTVDIDRALEMLYGDALDVARLETGNPELYALVMKAWEDARRRGETVSELRRAIEELMWKSYRAGIERGSYDLVAEDVRLSLDRARALRTDTPAMCVNFFNGVGVEETPGIAERQRALVIRTVLETGATPGKERERGKFRVSDEVIDRAAASAGISRETFLRATNFEGSETDQCDARIALMETALELPRSQGLQLLRDLS